jgi:5-methylcytosine-specific restriction endonuclease McrBC regulatory subunit McrC
VPEYSIEEAVTTKVNLSREEATALNRLGQELASRNNFWGAVNAESEPEESERTIVRVRPTFDPSCYEIFVDNAVGMIGVGETRISVQPKIPAEHLVYLLNQSGHLPRSVPQPASTGGDENLVQLLSAWYVSALENLLRSDLIRDYRELRANDLSSLRGTLNVEGTAGNYYRGSLVFDCTYSEFDVDTALNRLLKAAALKITQNSLINEITRRRSRRCLSRFDGVSHERWPDLEAQTDRRSTHYRSAPWLAKALLHSESRTVHHGNTSAWCFLFPTPWAVEEGLRSLLQLTLSDVCEIEKRGRELGSSGIRIFPDVQFKGCSAVADIKYKVYKAAWPRADLYQSVAFAAGVSVLKAAVFSFSEEPAALQDIPFGAISVKNITWLTRLTADEAQAAFSNEVRQWLVGYDLRMQTG